ncbi:PAS domain S-box-containing protein [Bacillus nitratireducens]|nr:PAS domain S-box-containing protein [Bacillus nitratireducens]
MEITLFLQSLSIYDQVIFSYKALPFFIIQYILLFSGFAIKFIKHYSIRGLAQFSFDSIFIVIMNIYFTLTFILDISSFRMLTTDTWLLIGYFIAQSLVIYAVISLYRREQYSSSRISLIIGFTIILVYGYIHLFQLNKGMETSSEVSYLIHTASILLIGLSSILYILDKPMQHETKMKYYRFDYVRFILPYFSIIITFSIIVIQPWDDKFMLIGLVLSLILLFLRQLYMWKDNQVLIDTYEQLTTQLEGKVEEGASALSKSEQRYKSLFEDHPDAVFSLNMNGIFQQSNKACESLFTAYYCEVTSYSLLHFIDPQDHEVLKKSLQSTKEGRPQTLEIRTKEKEGYYYYLHITFIPIFINKEVVGMFGIARDITTLYEKQKQVEHLAFHDALTGLPNRRKFEKDLKTILNTAQNELHFLEGELSKALQQNEFFLEYQPQVNTKTKQIIGFEALIRWKHPKLGIVSPAQFIPLAEETGFIIELGNWILRTACLEAKRWHNQGFSHLKLGVNLSVVQFNHADLIPTISKVLEETELKPEALDIEITESIAINQNQSVVAKLEQLQNLGIQISIDDFGTGYSSLAYLTKYPINTLKIAREFICGITNSPLEEAIIASIIKLSKELNLEVIAEGVETEEQWKFLHEQNCDHIQGFLFSKPVSSEDVWMLLHKKTTV